MSAPFTKMGFASLAVLGSFSLSLAQTPTPAPAAPSDQVTSEDLSFETSDEELVKTPAPSESAPKSAESALPTNKNVSLSQNGKALNWPSDLKWSSFKTPRGRILRGPVLAITLPQGVSFDPAQLALEQGSIIPKKENEKEDRVVRLRLGSLQDSLRLDATSSPVQIQVKLGRGRVEVSSCNKQSLKVERIGSPASTPYYLLFSCVRRAGRIFVSFSHPLELDSFSSTAVEREGKGEGYKVYELTTSSNLGREGELMRFEFKAGGESQKFRIIDEQRTGKTEEAREPIFVYRTSLSVGPFSVQAPLRSQSSIQPNLGAEIRTAPFFGGFAGSGAIFVSPGISVSGDPQTFLSFDGGLGFRMGGGPRGNLFYFEPSLRFFAIHQEFSKIGISAHHNQPGLGIVLGTKGALDPSGFEISLGASGYGLTEKSSHVEAGVRYAFLLGKFTTGLGLSYAQQQQKPAEGAVYDFQRILLQFYYWP